MREQTLVQSNIDDLNSYLSKNVVRYISAGASSGSHFEFIDTWFKVATPYTVADAYIKGETWTRLLKEGDVTGGGADITIDSELSDTSENPVQNKVVTEALGILGEHLAVHSKQISSLGLSMATKTDVDNAIANAITTTLNTAV